MTIEEAYEKMKAGHKVAHNSYDQDEFNWMSKMEIIYDENKYRWGYKWDVPWDMRVNHEDGWFDDDWFVCDEREFKQRPTNEIDYQKEFLKSDGKVFMKEQAERVPILPNYGATLENIRVMAESFNTNKNEYARNHDGSMGFSAKKNREANAK